MRVITLHTIEGEEYVRHRVAVHETKLFSYRIKFLIREHFFLLENEMPCQIFAPEL